MSFQRPSDKTQRGTHTHTHTHRHRHRHTRIHIDTHTHVYPRLLLEVYGRIEVGGVGVVAVGVVGGGGGGEEEEEEVVEEVGVELDKE